MTSDAIWISAAGDLRGENALPFIPQAGAAASEVMLHAEHVTHVDAVTGCAFRALIEHHARRRATRVVFTPPADVATARLMHEFKHVLDHTTSRYLYRDRPGSSAHEQAERVADYFAACLLMPKRVVKRLWGERHQDIALLAETLQVSPAALRYRLDQLGLTERPRRCARPARTHSGRWSLAGVRH